MATLYVTEPGARIEREYKRILVTLEGKVLTSVPISQLSEVVLVGWTGATTPALLMLLDNGIGLTLMTASGKLRGRLRPPEAHNLPLRHRQFERSQDPDFCLAAAKAMIAGKLKNSRTIAMRIKRRAKVPNPLVHSQLERLEHALAAVPQTDSIAKLRGIEGSGARAYFAILRTGLDWKGQPFIKRTKRPPKDPLNALLSLGYSLLTNAMITACEIAGLDSYDGFFHADKYGRPALALDLVEEFRPVVVDSLLLILVNKHILQERHFYTDDDGVFLTRSGRRKFFPQFVHRLNTTVHHPLAGRSLSYQKCFEIQARQMRAVIEGKTDHYQPMRVR